MKALFTNVDPGEQAVLEAWAANAPLEVISTPKAINAKRVAEHSDTAILSFSTPSDITAELLEALPRLRFVAIRQTGINHVDTDYLYSKGIGWANLADYCSDAVAEHLFALLLSVAKQLPTLLPHTRTGQFTRSSDSLGWELRGKTLGLVGLGHTAQAVLPIAKGFGMNVLVHNRSEKPELAERYGYKHTDLATLLNTSDVVSLHVPVTAGTRHLMDDTTLAKLKPEAVLVNLGRGALVDSRAVLNALDTHQLGAYCCDVLPTEKLLAAPTRLKQTLLSGEATEGLEALLVDQLLLQHPRVFATPHTAFYTKEAVAQQMRQTLNHIDRFLKA